MVAPLNVSIASSPTSAQGAAPAATGANWVDDIVADVDAIPDLSDEKAVRGPPVIRTPCPELTRAAERWSRVVH